MYNSIREAAATSGNSPRANFLNDIIFIEQNGQSATGRINPTGKPTDYWNEGGGPDLAPFIDIFPDFGVIIPEIDFGGFSYQGSDISFS